jgi:hypothetical protein
VAEREKGQTALVLASSAHYWAGSAVALGALGLIVLICRWVFAAPPRSAPSPTHDRGDFGLLVPITVVRTRDDAQMLRGVLRQAGIRGTVADAPGGFAVLVFRDDASRARDLVRS